LASSGGFSFPLGEAARLLSASASELHLKTLIMLAEKERSLIEAGEVRGGNSVTPGSTLAS
jgi:hypothetical protein